MSRTREPSTVEDPQDFWAAIRKGDQQAEAVLCRRAEDVARRFFCRADSRVRDDLVQETMLSVIRFARRAESPPRNLREFLQWRCRGVLSAYLKGVRARPRFEPKDDLSMFPDETLPANDQREMRKDLVDCVNRLPTPAQTIFRDRCRGRTVSEIARERAHDASWASRQLKDILLALRACLARKGHAES
jgi:RNA polymerase sigma factor (sigma-70 family)